MNAFEKLENQIKIGNHIAVGLDSDISRIPMHLHKNPDPILDFNKIIINNTLEHAAAYKINFAFYERDGNSGFETLKKTIEYIPKDKLIIGDAKRGDIGNTSEMYALSLYNYFQLDSVTLHPYMGFDSIEPFLKYEDKLNYVLALTSNKGSKDFEKLQLSDGKYLYQKVIEKVLEWNVKKNCGIVFGATNSEELKANINSFGDLSVLLPGVGAQGGSLEDVIKIFKIVNKNNYIINISRSLIYINDSEEFGKAVFNEIKSVNEKISELISL